MNIGENIRTLRKAEGWTQKELAERLNRIGLEISEKTISSWEINRTTPTIGFVEKLAEVFKCKKTDIIGENIYGEYYFLNEETRRIAQEAYENPDLRILFDAARDTTPEDLKMAIEIVKRLKKERD